MSSEVAAAQQEIIEEFHLDTIDLGPEYKAMRTHRTPVGCELCMDSGYKGRVGVYEVLALNDEIRQILRRPHKRAHQGFQCPPAFRLRAIRGLRLLETEKPEPQGCAWRGLRHDREVLRQNRPDPGIAPYRLTFAHQHERQHRYQRAGERCSEHQPDADGERR